MRTRHAAIVVPLVALAGSPARAAIVAAAGPGALDALMGTPLLAVTDDGTPLGTIYGHAPSLTPGIPLPTPIGDMGFSPSHDRVALGTPFSSGTFHALLALDGGPIAGSDVHAPAGANAMDFFIAAVPGASHTFEITAVGTATTASILVPGVAGVPVYVGFGAFGEDLLFVSIVKLPFPSPTVTTWEISDIRVLPAPAGAPALLALLAFRRRR